MTVSTKPSSSNKNGNKFEAFILERIQSEGYNFVNNKKFMDSKILSKPIYTKGFTLGESIYGNPLKCDFILYHPQKHPKCLVIEAKWQQASGSVDEKFPYLTVNIKKQSPYDTIIIIDGSGYRPNALNWLKKQVGDNLKGVFSMAEFTAWVNKEGI